MPNSNISDIMKNLRHKKLELYFFGALVGLFTGMVVVFYRLALNYASELHEISFNALSENLSPGNIFITILLLILFSLILGYINTYVPMAKGSGIPQVKGVLVRQLSFDWLKELIAKFFGGVVAIGTGMSLGREGPSVHLGAEIGKGFFKVFKREDPERKYLVSCGASAGLAAAFNAPLAGAIFSIEELHKFMSPLLITCVLISSVVSDFVSKYFFGLEPSFTIKVESGFGLHDYHLIIIFALIVTIIGKLFGDWLVKFQEIFAKIPLPPIIKPIVIIFIVFMVGIFFRDVTGGGHHLAEEIINHPFSYKTLFLLLALKFLFTLICYSSGAPGGIFLPILVIGAISGKIYGMLMVDYFGYQESYVIYFIILGMASLLTAVVKAPITGTILILEMTGSFEHFFPLITVTMVTFLITEILEMIPIYDTLLERMLENHEIEEGDIHNKLTIRIPVGPDSYFENKKICEVTWPNDCLIVGIKRGEKEIIPKGKHSIMSGDVLIILTNESTAKVIKLDLLKKAQEVIL
ncbi:ClC family H(+)/Cl(-) exchange transporter [Ilyobacter polytropus]|uniref:Cl-channel voltage-gated family protein n=1 Tax=Ilyobacter polytropus (strain ATCC 51220 / DSM 2926 / LMG 16218 / CuHBu1) TaxID=572544 RepID=E3H7V1_ILYPC|nr:ClC family H(+)/Cl(-) exchange transporter [Ilyobacter polytropus]ADO82903.1 Cl- channel voltage-gated family protein [Ilyobacter polytropus DSM 2926]